MREIKFRGIPTYGKDFVYGSLIININEAGRKEYLIKKHIGIIEVIPETVGQYTGLKDKNGMGLTKIYECDIIDENGNIKGSIYEVDARETDIVIPQLGTKAWNTAYKEAVGRGFDYAE